MSQVQDDQPTCGKGIAANAVLPERMAKLLRAMVGIYENHMRSLDRQSESGRKEIAAYERLARDFGAAAAQVDALADAMRGYRDLPMADHNMAALMDSASIEAMEALVLAQEELFPLLRDRASEFRGMLEEMKKGAG